MSDALTAQQLQFVEYLADPSDQRTQAEVAQELGVCRETVSRWKRTKHVWELSFSLALLHVGAELGKVLGVLHRSVMTGDIRAARLLFEVSGVMQPQAVKNLFVREAYLAYLNPNEQIVYEMDQLTDAQHQVLAEACERIEGILTTDWGLMFDAVSVTEDWKLAINVLTSSVGDGVCVDDRALHLILVPAA